MSRYLMTASLLNAWIWSYSKEGFEAFLKALRREPTQQNKAMLDGIQFENMVSAWNKGYKTDKNHKWYKSVEECAKLLKCSQEQVKVYSDYSCAGVNFLLYGRLDNLKRGIIYDTKFSTKYYYGKYADCPQHSMYFELVPEAKKFIYLVADGKEVFKEEYRRFDYKPVDEYIKPFIIFLNSRGLTDLYYEKWITKE